MANIEELIKQISERLDAMNDQYGAVNGYLDALTTSIDSNSADIAVLKEKLLHIESISVKPDEIESIKNDIQKLFEVVG